MISFSVSRCQFFIIASIWQVQKVTVQSLESRVESPNRVDPIQTLCRVQKAGFGESLEQKRHLAASPQTTSSVRHAKAALEEEEKSGKRHAKFRKGLLQAPEQPSVPPTDEYRVLPAWYSDNFVTLVPGESRTFELSCAVTDADLHAPEVWISGWNVELERVL